MFKKKNQKIPQTQALAITPREDEVFEEAVQELEQQPQQPQQIQQQPQPIQQPQQPQQPQVQPQQVPPQQQQQQIQQPQQQIQQQPYAYVKQIQLTEPGIFHFVIETNYPLAIGYCQLAQ